MTPMRATESEAEARGTRSRGILARAALLGTLFGFVLVKAEVVSWFRIQEMFRFQSFHMYGILGSAVLVGMTATWLLRSFGAVTIDGERIAIRHRESRGLNRRYWLGGATFGLGWGLLGACPGPIYALIGTGSTVLLVALASALFGTWAYAALRHRLPHY